MTLTNNAVATLFSLRTPYLLQGITTDTVSQTDTLKIAIKVYAAGGENRMHRHVGEDHSFVVLEGQATFYLNSEDEVHVAGPTQGVMIPKDAFYCFENSGDTNLVMLRVSANLGGKGAYYPDGEKKGPGHEPYIYTERIEDPGPQFGDGV